MRNLNDLSGLRDAAWERRINGYKGDETCGAFKVPVGKATLRVMASSGEGWDHLSVSLGTRCPTWEEMEAVKRLFFMPHETAMQIHVPTTDHISVHHTCLHIWRPHDMPIPTPPSWMVA